MNEIIKMSDFVAAVRKKALIKQLIPMEMGMGWPMLSIRNKRLCVIIPFYKAIIQPEDRTLIYPLAFSITVLWPNGRILEFKNLKYSHQFSKIDYTKAVGTFRHEAIINLNKEMYQEKKNEVFALYDELISCLFTNEQFSCESEDRLSKLISTLMEPSLKPFYKALDIDFYNKFLND